MTDYQHTQRSSRVRALFLVAGCGALVALWAASARLSTGPRLTLGAAALVLLVTAFVFSRFTIRVDADRLAWHFGPGVLAKAVPVVAIASAEPTATSALEGWGVHLTTRGWLYNVAGKGAVLVTLGDGTRFLLGSDEPDVLVRAIRTAQRPR
jgi:hypothetical protein